MMELASNIPYVDEMRFGDCSFGFILDTMNKLQRLGTLKNYTATFGTSHRRAIYFELCSVSLFQV